MITVNNYRLTPTIFPDLTSQIYQLPEEILLAEDLLVDWRFEHEREIFDLLSLRKLNKKGRLHLYIPYLPFARQDKKISNETTFNLHVFADLINSLKPTIVESLDVHSAESAKLIKRFCNIQVRHFIQRLREDINAQVLVFPDESAAARYEWGFPNQIIFTKERDPLTGKIIAHKILEIIGEVNHAHFLLVDDLADGGATFISAAKTLRKEVHKEITVSLWTTHGLYSRGRKYLLDDGINALYTTDSLIRNRGLVGVTKV